MNRGDRVDFVFCACFSALSLPFFRCCSPYSKRCPVLMLESPLKEGGGPGGSKRARTREQERRKKNLKRC